MKATYAVDGVALDDPKDRWRLEAATKVPASASRNVQTVDLATRDGAIGVRQGMGTGQVGLVVAITDVTAAASGDLSSVDGCLSAIVSLLAEAKTVTYTAGTGHVRTADVVEVAVSDPEVRSRRTAIVSATLTVAPYWSDATAITTADKALTNGSVTFAELAGSTGRLQDAIVRLKGPFNSVVMTDAYSGTSATYGTAVAAGTYLYVQTWPFLRAWTSTSSSAWTTGTAVVIDYPAAGPLQVWPARGTDPTARAPRLNVTVTGQTTASAIALQSRKWFL